MDDQVTPSLDEASRLECLQEVIDPRAGGTHNVGERFLRHVGHNVLQSRTWAVTRIVSRQGEERPGEALLAGTLKPFYQLIFQLHPAGKEVRHETLCQDRLGA